MSKNQFHSETGFHVAAAKTKNTSSRTHTSAWLLCHSLALVWKIYKTEGIVKCHPYLWLAPHLPLPRLPCLNPQSACYIYIVMRAPLLTKHFLFDCTHKKAAYKLLSQIPRENSSGYFSSLGSSLESGVMSFILFDIKSQRFFLSTSPPSTSDALFLLLCFAFSIFSFSKPSILVDVRKFMRNITRNIFTFSLGVSQTKMARRVCLRSREILRWIDTNKFQQKRTHGRFFHFHSPSRSNIANWRPDGARKRT